MRIQRISVGKRDKNKLILHFEDGTSIPASADDAYMLKAGSDISEEEVSALHKKYTDRRARASAARTLSHHSVSRARLSDKLKERGYSEKDAEETADWFVEKGLVDDERYAVMCAEYYKKRGYGILKIREELRRRGISKELSEETVARLGGFTDEIVPLIKKKLKSYSPDHAEKQKITSYLLRRGYKYDEIRSAFSELEFDTEDMF